MLPQEAFFRRPPVFDAGFFHEPVSGFPAKTGGVLPPVKAGAGVLTHPSILICVAPRPARRVRLRSPMLLR